MRVCVYLFIVKNLTIYFLFSLTIRIISSIAIATSTIFHIILPRAILKNGWKSNAGAPNVTANGFCCFS